MKTIYQVSENADLTEGRGPMVPVAYFEDEDDAWEWAEKHARTPMGVRPEIGLREHYKRFGYCEVQVKPIELHERKQKPMEPHLVHGIKTIHKD